jgi:hypothetical protein
LEAGSKDLGARENGKSFLTSLFVFNLPTHLQQMRSHEIQYLNSLKKLSIANTPKFSKRKSSRSSKDISEMLQPR